MKARAYQRQNPLCPASQNRWAALCKRGDRVPGGAGRGRRRRVSPGQAGAAAWFARPVCFALHTAAAAGLCQWWPCLVPLPKRTAVARMRPAGLMFKMRSANALLVPSTGMLSTAVSHLPLPHSTLEQVAGSGGPPLA